MLSQGAPELQQLITDDVTGHAIAEQETDAQLDSFGISVLVGKDDLGEAFGGVGLAWIGVDAIGHCLDVDNDIALLAILGIDGDEGQEEQGDNGCQGHASCFEVANESSAPLTEMIEVTGVVNLPKRAFCLYTAGNKTLGLAEFEHELCLLESSLGQT